MGAGFRYIFFGETASLASHWAAVLEISCLRDSPLLMAVVLSSEKSGHNLHSESHGMLAQGGLKVPDDGVEFARVGGCQSLGAEVANSVFQPPVHPHPRSEYFMVDRRSLLYGARCISGRGLREARGKGRSDLRSRGHRPVFV